MALSRITLLWKANKAKGNNKPIIQKWLPSTLPPANLSPSTELVKEKMWPYDFKVYQINNGLIQIRNIMEAHIIQPKARWQSRKSRMNNSQKSQPKSSIMVKKAFKSAFPNTTYKKATFYEHRALWEEQKEEDPTV